MYIEYFYSLKPLFLIVLVELLFNKLFLIEGREKLTKDLDLQVLVRIYVNICYCFRNDRETFRFALNSH